MTPYLRLCMKTWGNRLGKHEVVVLDHAALSAYLGDGGFDMPQLTTLPLMVQKDAIMVAVLRRHGGIFLDVDTLAVDDIGPLFTTVERAEVVLIARHMAFMAARPGAPLLDRWYATIQAALTARATQDPTTETPWDFLGNRLLIETMDDLIVHHEDKPVFVRALDGAVALADHLAAATASGTAPAGLHRLMTRVASAAARRRRDGYFASYYRHHLTSLDRDAMGYMPERPWFAGQPLAEMEQYLRFWFSDEIGLDAVLGARPRLIGLHNSWTPQWYADLSEADVLAHGCLLSRTLRHLLERDPA